MAAEIPSDLRRQVDKAISLLKKGGVVAFPTDTVYGLGAAASVQAAIARVYELKKRPLNMPVSLLLSNVSQMSRVAATVTPVAVKLAEAFFPGALTLVLPRSAAVLDIVTAGGDNVAVRVPNHPVALAIIEELGEPVLGTSANISGRPSALTADDVRAQFGSKLDFIVSGDCYGGVESTVVDVTGDKPVILRQGAISAGDIMKACE